MDKGYLHRCLFLFLLALCAACTEHELPGTAGGGAIDYDPGHVELRLVIPSMVDVVTRASDAEETRISTLHLVTYDASGACKECSPVNVNELTDNGDGTHSLWIDLTDEPAQVHLVANAGNALDTKPATSLDQVLGGSLSAPLTLWGYRTVADIKAGQNSIVLLRSVAKASLTKASSLTDFQINGWKIVCTANKGMIAPAGYVKDGNVTTVTEVEYNKEVGSLNSYNSDVCYFYETPSSVDTRIVIKGTLNGSTQYYSANILEAGTRNRMPLRRNHYYQLTVTGADGNGYGSEADALAADPGNISLEIKDHNYAISDMVSNGQYELGVTDRVDVDTRFETDSKDFTATVVVMRADENTTAPEPTAAILSGSDWISNPSIAHTADISSGNYSSPGKQYTVTFTCQKNPREVERQGSLQITCGDLSRTILVVQAAANLKMERDTYIYGLQGDGANWRDYTTFIMSEAGGVSAAANGGTQLNNGLHLGIGEVVSGTSYNYSYRIEKKAGDAITHADSRISCTEENGYYKVVAKDLTESSSWRATGGLKIRNSTGVEISYDLYHTGFFWQITDVAHQTGNSSLQRSGWHYYGVVQAHDGVYMLDRNLGAASIDDAGAYFRIKQGNASQPVAITCPGGFKLPSFYVWSDVLQSDQIRYNTRTDADGSDFTSVEIVAMSGGTIRLPRGGYCMGTQLRNSTIGYYWSTSILTGNQGFDSSSPDYGFWFRIARVSTSGCMMSTTRYVAGSNGEVGDPYCYMNVRCVKDVTYEMESDTELTVIDRRTDKSQPLYIYISTADDEYRNYPNGERLVSPMTVGGETVYRYEMIDPDLIWDSMGLPLFVRFRSGDSWLDGATQIGVMRVFIVSDTSSYAPMDAEDCIVSDMPAEWW